MEGDKVVVPCAKCSTNNRIPVKETLIKFKCSNPNCREEYYALLGSIVPKPEEPVYEPAKPSVVKEVFDKLRKFFNSKTFWMLISAIFFVISLYLLILHFHDRKPKKMQDELTNEILSNLKDYNKRDFEKIKSKLTDESKKIFELLLENQLAYNDSARVRNIEGFIKSIKPLEYQTSRRFSYVNSNNDTAYFRIDYVPIGDDDYLISFNLEDFIK